MVFVFTLSMALLYMVLASQFNSFLQPAIVMLAQPLAIVGGVAALWAFGQTLNIYSMIGLVLLVGLVAKNSILLVDLTNQPLAIAVIGGMISSTLLTLVVVPAVYSLVENRRFGRRAA